GVPEERLVGPVQPRLLDRGRGGRGHPDQDQRQLRPEVGGDAADGTGRIGLGLGQRVADPGTGGHRHRARAASAPAAPRRDRRGRSPCRDRPLACRRPGDAHHRGRLADRGTRHAAVQDHRREGQLGPDGYSGVPGGLPVKYRDLNASPRRTLAEIVGSLSERATTGNTGAHGIKHMGRDGDTLFTTPDGLEKSMRDLDAILDITREELAEAIRELEELNNVTLPELWEKLDQLDELEDVQEILDELARLDSE